MQQKQQYEGLEFFVIHYEEEDVIRTSQVLVDGSDGSLDGWWGNEEY